MEFVRNMLVRNARSLGAKPALICEDQLVTHSDLNERVNRLANSFLERGWGKGTVIAIFVKNSIEFVELLFACQKVGATATPANTRYRTEELRHQVIHSAATVLFFDADATSIVTELRGSDSSRTYGVVGPDGPEWAISLSALQGSGASATEPPPTVLGRGDIATILYTSGTTGSAKGIPVSYVGGLYTGILEANADIGLTEGDIALCAAPLFHQGVYGMNLMMPLMVGGTVVIQKRFDPDGCLRLIERHNITYAFLVPTMLDAILRSPELSARRIDSFRKVMSSGSSLSERTKDRVLRAFPQMRLFENYGATESFNSLRLSPADTRRKVACVGLPVLTQQVRLVTGSGQEASVEEVGEIWVRGPTVLTNYHRPAPDLPPAVDEQGWFHTGDLARRDEDGYFYIVGRSKEMIISGGENIYPSEIEDVISSVPGVAECAVVGQPDEYWGEIVSAYVVRSKPDLSEEAITEICVKQLARYKRPRMITFIDALPRNAAGKVMRRLLVKSKGAKP
jgi:acyl-CoA synthetase (AMP-forming)/AMP-acid ligase II